MNPNNFDRQRRKVAALPQSEVLFLRAIGEEELVQEYPSSFSAFKRSLRRLLQLNGGALE